MGSSSKKRRRGKTHGPCSLAAPVGEPQEELLPKSPPKKKPKSKPPPKSKSPQKAKEPTAVSAAAATAVRVTPPKKTPPSQSPQKKKKIGPPPEELPKSPLKKKPKSKLPAKPTQNAYAAAPVRVTPTKKAPPSQSHQIKKKIGSPPVNISSNLKVASADDAPSKALPGKSQQKKLSKYEENWNQKCSELVEYKKEHGNCNVPNKYPPNPKLGVWVDNQRSAMRNNKLSEEKANKLESIGFTFDLLEASWEKKFNELVEYKNQHGNCNVPRSNPKLGMWVNNQRAAMRKNKLSEERVNKLESIGFTFDPLEASWEDNYNKLLEYKIRYQQAIGPVRKGMGYELAKWINKQRQVFLEGKLDKGRIKLLDEIDFAWKVSTRRKTWWATKKLKPIPEKPSGFAAQKMHEWRKYYNELKRFYKENDHWNVPRNSKYSDLNNWMDYQNRSFCERGNMHKDKLKLLKAIGFQFKEPKLPKSLTS